MKDFLSVNSNSPGTCIPFEMPRFTGLPVISAWQETESSLKNNNIALANFPVSPDNMEYFLLSVFQQFGVLIIVTFLSFS